MPTSATVPPFAGHRGRLRQAKLPARFSCRNGASEIGEYKPFGAIRDLRQGQWFARSSTVRRVIFRRRHTAPLLWKLRRRRNNAVSKFGGTGSIPFTHAKIC